MKIEFYFKNEVKAKTSEAEFLKILNRALKILKKDFEKIVGKNNGFLSLILLSDENILRLNKKYRKKPFPTDVLSFCYRENKNFEKFFIAGHSFSIGDIFISVDTAKRQAIEHNHSFKKELQILFTHGLLHLLGYDHGNDEEEAEMESAAEKIN